MLRQDNKRQLTPLAGLWSGIGELLSQPGQYYVQSNWAGRGLANSGLGYLADRSYRDPFSAGQALAALGSMGRDNNNLLSGLGSLNKRGELYGSVADSIDKYARPTQYDLYSNNYGYMDNNYGDAISRGITNYFNGVPDNNSIQGVYIMIDRKHLHLYGMII